MANSFDDPATPSSPISRPGSSRPRGAWPVPDAARSPAAWWVPSWPVASDSRPGIWPPTTSPWPATVVQAAPAALTDGALDLRTLLKKVTPSVVSIQLGQANGDRWSSSQQAPARSSPPTGSSSRTPTWSTRRT